MPTANTRCAAPNYSSVAGTACVLLALGVLVLPHALVTLAPGMLLELPALLPHVSVPDVMVRWKLMLFYPFTILHLVAPAHSPWLYFDLFHCAVGAAGVYLATARWTGNNWMAVSLAALVLPFAASGLASSSALAALAWTPWLLGLAESAFTTGARDLALCAALAAVQLLAGSIEVVVLSWSCLAIFAGSVFVRTTIAWQLRLKRLGAFVVLALLLAATQVVPLIDIPVRMEIRPGGTDVDLEQQNRPVLVRGNWWVA